jgi:hypothetical protein
MNRYKIFLSAATFMLIVLSNSCTDDFAEINTNNNDPALSQAAPDMLLTGTIEVMTDRVHEIFFGHEMGSCWVQHMAKVQYTDEDRYIPRMGVINNTWNSFYAQSGMDASLLIDLGVETNNPSYQAIGLILKSYIVSVVTDEWGDVPYTEAFLGSAVEPILSPKYDKQADIYVALLANLEQANTLLDEGAAIGGDILYKGNLTKWKKFANSLRLRLLLRQSDKVDPTAAMTEIVNDPATYPIFTSNDDDAELIYLGAYPNNNPIHENRKTRDDHRVSATLVDMTWNSGAVEPDYRIMAYANVADNSGDYVGLPNGMFVSDAAAYLGNGMSETSKIGDYFSVANAPGVLMSNAELQFILAEAAHRTFIPGGEADAEAYYVEGITTSYLKYTEAIEQGVIDYYGSNPGDYLITDMLDWFLTDGGYTYKTADATRLIATQKWVAMFGQGVQAAFEWRRTGFPVLSPAVDAANGGLIPVRAYYPSDEAGRNPTNLSNAVAGQGPDTLNTRVWWDIN